MSFLSVKNRAESALASGIDDSDPVDLTVTTGEGTKFPASNFHITIEDEILLCTSRTDDVLTCDRAKEGTSAVAHATGKAVELRITAGIITELQQASGGFTSRARAYLSTLQSIAKETTTKIEFDAESYDGDEEFDPVTNHRFVAANAGYYMVVGSVRWAIWEANKTPWLYIYRSGAIHTSIHNYRAEATGWVMQISDIIYLAANQYIEIFVRQDTSDSVNISNLADRTFVSIHRLS